MHLTFLDYHASSGNTPIHRASPLSKIAVVAIVVAAVILSRHPQSYLVLAVVLAALTLLARIPLREVAAILAYPAALAALLGFAGFRPESLPAWLVIARAVSVALAVIILFGTTAYGRVFAFFRFFFPAIVVDALFLTYRTFFILLGQWGSFLTGIRLKGGLSPSTLKHDLRNVSAAFGLTCIRALEMSERMYQIMNLRGYQRQIQADTPWYRVTGFDLIPLAGGAGILIGTVIFR